MMVLNNTHGGEDVIMDDEMHTHASRDGMQASLVIKLISSL
jgi:hypothetical protein